jgi:hypothetical protein
VGEQYGYRYEAPSVSGTLGYQKARFLYVGSYEGVFAKSDLSLSQSVSRSQARTAIGNYHTRQTNTDWYGSAAYRYYWSEAVSTRVGLTYDQRTIQLAGQFPRYPYALGETAPTLTDTITRRRSLWEAYLYMKAIHGPLVLGAGVRSSLPGAVFHYLSYQGNVRCNLSGEQFLNLAGGQYHSLITPEAATYPFQLVQTRQLALDYSYTGSGWTLSAAVYSKHEQGAGNADILGAEAYAQHTLGKRLTADLSAASLRVRMYSAANNGLFYTATQRDLPFSFKSNWQATLPWLNAGLIIQYRAGVPYTPIVGGVFDRLLTVYQPLYPAVPNASRLPAYFRADLSMSKLLKLAHKRHSLLLYATLNNIFNTLNVSAYSYNVDYSVAKPIYFQRRSIYMGLVFTLH